MLKVKIKNIEFNSPIIAASGTFGYGNEFGDFVNLKKILWLKTRKMKVIVIEIVAVARLKYVVESDR